MKKIQEVFSENSKYTMKQALELDVEAMVCLFRDHYLDAISKLKNAVDYGYEHYGNYSIFNFSYLRSKQSKEPLLALKKLIDELYEQREISVNIPLDLHQDAIKALTLLRNFISRPEAGWESNSAVILVLKEFYKQRFLIASNDDGCDALISSGLKCYQDEFKTKFSLSISELEKCFSMRDLRQTSERRERSRSCEDWMDENSQKKKKPPLHSMSRNQKHKID